MRERVRARNWSGAQVVLPQNGINARLSFRMIIVNITKEGEMNKDINTNASKEEVNFVYKIGSCNVEEWNGIPL